MGDVVKLTPKPRRKIAPPQDDPTERTKLFAAFAIAKTAHLSIPMLRAAGVSAGLCDELDRATSERAVRLLALLVMSGEGA